MQEKDQKDPKNPKQEKQTGFSRPLRPFSPLGPSPAILLIGVGNPYRRDDGAGLRLAREIQALVPGAVFREQSGEGVALMQAWEGAHIVVICDATVSGAAPGTIHRLDASEDRVPDGLYHRSTHTFGVSQALELSRKLGTLPPRLLLYGIEGRDFSGGEGCSPEVEAAIPEAARRAAQDILALRSRALP